MHILIIEDDPAIATNLYDFLEARGHSVDAAADGITGLHLAVTQKFDGILLDIGLPAMDGITLCRKLRQEADLDTPVLMLTARDTLEDKPKCIRLLALMMSEPGRVFSRRELESEVWGDTQGTSDTLRSHMHELRRALSRAGGYDPIETIHGLGYRLISRARD